LLRDRHRLSAEARTDLDALIAHAATKRTARAWLYREGLRAILRSQADQRCRRYAQAMVHKRFTLQGRADEGRRPHDPQTLRGHRRLDPTRQTNGFIEALNGLFQAAKRKARGYTRFATMRTVLFLIAGKLDFTAVNPHALNPLQIQ
jgi:transposase